MFKILLSLIIIFNIVAISILVTTIVCTFIGTIRKEKYINAKVLLPTFYNCRDTFIRCCVSSSIFAIVAWILYSPQAMTETWDSTAILANILYTFGVIWSVLLIISIVLEIVLGFFKNKTTSLKYSFLPLFIRSLWCLLLAFLIV